MIYRGVVASAFPMAEALRNPDFGFVETPREVMSLADFTAPEVGKLKGRSPDMVVVFTRTWDPLTCSTILRQQLSRQPIRLSARNGADEIAKALSMNVARRWTRRGLSLLS